MSLELWIPPTAREKKRYLLCDIPGCKKRFPLGQRQQFERHVKACLRRNGDVLEEHVAKRDRDHGAEDFDLELQAYLRKTGRLPSEA